MCRSIKTLRGADPTAEEVRAAALQFVRKISGFTHPSLRNQGAFDHAVDDITAIARQLMSELETNAPPRDREIEAQKAKARSAQRFGVKAPA